MKHLKLLILAALVAMLSAAAPSCEIPVETDDCTLNPDSCQNDGGE